MTALPVPTVSSKFLLLLLLLVVAFAAFGSGLSGEFLNFDDNRVVLENPVFRMSFGPGLAKLLSEPLVDVYLPVSYLSLWADWAVAGASPMLYHVHSLVLHALAAFVLILLMIDLGIPRLAALAGTLVFLLHPAMAESVTWISSRKDVLSGLLVVLALWYGLRACHGRARPWLVWVFALLACYAKATAVVLPLLAFGLWRIDRERLVEARFWRTWVPVAVLCLLAGIHHSVIAAMAGTAEFAGNAAAVPGTFLHYLGQILWPAGLAVHHPRGLLTGFAEGAPVKLLWLVTLATLALLLLVRGRGTLRYAGLGLLLMFAALLPFNGWRPAFAIAAADRYLYLALPCVAFAVAGLIAAMPARVGRGIAVLVCFAGMGLGFATSVRAQAFTRSDRLWQANLAVYPHDAVALTNLAQWELTAPEGEGPRAARPLLARAAREATMLPHRLRIVTQQLRCALVDGDLDGAQRCATQAVVLADGLPTDRVRVRIDLRLQLVSLLERLDRRAAADGVLDEVLALDPKEPHALGRKAAHLLAKAAAAGKRLPLPSGTPELIRAKKILDAVQASDRVGESAEPMVAAAEYHRLLGETSRAFAALETWHGPPRESIFLERARIYEAEGLLNEAIRTLEEGMRSPVVSVRLPLRLAALYERLPIPRMADAEALLRAAYDSQPGHAKLRAAYARALIARARQLVGRRPVREWEPLVVRARKLGADSPRLLLLEARVLAASKKLDAAIRRARQAQAALPEARAPRELVLDLLKQKGYALLLSGKRRAAFRCFRDAIAQAPTWYDTRSIHETLANEFRAREEAATQALLAGKITTAEAGFRAALELCPEDEGARLKLGMTLLKESRHADALVSFRESMRDAERHGSDPGMALLYRMKTLDVLQRPAAAVRLADAYLDGAEQRKLRDTSLRERIRGLAEKLRDE